MGSAVESEIARPSVLLLVLEPIRAWMALIALPFVLFFSGAPRGGDGQPVLVIPGFGTTDLATLILRKYLSWIGYRCWPWKLGRNLGYRTLGENETRLRARLHEIHDATGRKVSIVGWSLGGVMARRLACTEPGITRQVVTLGSPFTGNPKALSIRSLYEKLSGERLDTPEAAARFARDRHRPPVPTTSIYTRSDGITAWQNCLEEPAPLSENIEVAGSHTGLVVNGGALRILADRLAEPEDDWRPWAPREGNRART